VIGNGNGTPVADDGSIQSINEPPGSQTVPPAKPKRKKARKAKKIKAKAKANGKTKKSKKRRR